MSAESVHEAGQELMEACKVALTHCQWMEANGFLVPPLPNGRTLQERLRAALDKAVRTGQMKVPKTEVLYLGGRGQVTSWPRIPWKRSAPRRTGPGSRLP